MKQVIQSAYTLNDQLIAEAEFFSRKHFFSYSAMNLLLYSPTIWYGKYVMNMEEEESFAKYLIEGKVIHCLLLDNQSFDKHFIVSPGKVPTENVLKVLNLVFRSNFDEIFDPLSPRRDLEHFEPEILEVLKEINLYQAFKDDKATKAEPNPTTGDRKRLDKILTPENVDYWAFQLKRGKEKKDIIDEATLRKCNDAVEIIKMAPNVMKLLGMTSLSEWDNVEVYNEEFMQADMKDYDWGLKGFLDNVKVDHDARTIFINDLKTTSKTLKNFSESVEFYNYWLQAGIYILLAIKRFKDLIKQGYQYKFHFIVVDTNLQVYAFPVSQETLNVWAKRTQETFQQVDFHYTQRKFDLPYEFELGTVCL